MSPVSPVVSPSPGALADAGTIAWGAIADKFTTWVLVILGWWVVSRGHNRREHRKEVRAIISDCIRDVREIEAKAHEYRLGTSAASPERKGLELGLKSRLTGLGATIGRLRNHDQIDVGEELTILRQAITGHDFESCSREQCAPDSVLVYEISAAAHGLIDALENAFRHRFR